MENQQSTPADANQSSHSGFRGTVTNPSLQIPAPIQTPSGFFNTALKLEDGNYTLWKDYKLWQRTDKSVMSFLFSSLTSEPLSQAVCYNSSHAVWESLRQRYESTSTTRVINLHIQMQQVRKEGKTMQQYLNTVKMYSDQLSAIGEPVRYKDYIWYLLEGLPAEYDPVVTAVYSRPDQPSVEEIHQLLLNFDIRLEKRHVSESVLPQTSPDKHHSLHKPLQSHDLSQSSEWLLDTGATHHVTPDLNDLTISSAYTGKSSVLVGNGHRLQIAHVGQTVLGSQTKPIILNQVLHTPNLSQHLVSVSKLCVDNNVVIEFNSDCFCVKDKETNQIILQGPASQGLYSLPPLTQINPRGSGSPTALLVKHSAADPFTWHCRLGHPN
ncbi:hypothetical protein MLD38_010035 [Melastoma candidum]|uniref:Uncharacterized protein n=1 Tax=Melastoma candidum TaxID=119954 RepID=A0ACB9QYI9_9MYRT|nr:hypothetical protein MLD38_010035 [Melastoma candidum]